MIDLVVPLFVILLAYLLFLADGLVFPDGLSIALNIGQLVILLAILDRLKREDTPS